MARLPRSALPAHGIYHVTARGVDRCAIVRDDLDRTRFVALLRAVAAREGLVVHAYCLMNNHFHAIVESSLEQLSRALQRVNGVYAQRFNRRHARTGHLFQERFHSKLVRDEAHLADACAYTWDNPVRAGLCDAAAQWPWNGRIA
jgi:REP element-mobilizing transposase RayT